MKTTRLTDRVTIISLGFLLVGAITYTVSIALRRGDIEGSLAGQITLDVSLAIIPAALFAVVYKWLVHDEEVKALTSALADVVGLRDQVCGIYSRRNEEDLLGFIRNTRGALDVVTPNLEWFASKRCLGELKGLVAKKCAIRILALDPTNSFVHQRYEQIRQENAGHFARTMAFGIKDLLAFKKEHGTDFLKLRVFNRPATIVAVRSDDEVVVGFVLAQQKSRECLHLRLKSHDGAPGHDFMTHFNLLWDDPSTEEASMKHVVAVDTKYPEVG